MKTYVATKNAGKLAEMRAIFAGSVLELDTYAGYADVDEDADDYSGNAALKARALARQLRDAGIVAAVLADDSGLEVEALGGRPGVRSARYAGRNATWADRRARLLSELRGVPEAARAARFVSAMVLVLSDGAELSAVGCVDGWIVSQERGAGGFGYDPLFAYPPRNLTFAQIGEREKNAVSHRRRAADALLAALCDRV
jgi:XTP/dITP diphosphohydrolase